jgi:hypothetical protein
MKLRNAAAAACALAGMALANAATAQTTAAQAGLTDAHIAPCNHLLSTRLAVYREPQGLSNLDFALSIPPFSPLYDLETTDMFIKSSTEVIRILENRDETGMQNVIGKIYRGQEYDDRLLGDRRFMCLLNVRRAQLTGKAPAPLPAQPQQVAARPISASDPAFTAKLQTSQPDQLVALARELIATGQIDLAKAARNALFSRYPDSPLIPVVVDMLVAASASAPAPPAAPPIATPIATPIANAAPAAAPRLAIHDAASLTSAFAQAGYTLSPTGTASQLMDSQNRFYAYFLDCDGTRCLGVQLLAKYSFSPMPTHDRIVQWNREKLYGRAYLSGNMVSFDMVIKIPSNGAEPLALKESIDLFLEASNAFYKHALGQ